MLANTKRKCTKSTHKHEGWENTKADKCKCKGKKVATKAHKTHHEEAKEDDLLVECKGKSSKVSELCVLILQLKSDKPTDTKCKCTEPTHKC
ncbi:hypothetical protein FRC11_006880, partial [Ceratobasidium sp. 423]